MDKVKNEVGRFFDVDAKEYLAHKYSGDDAHSYMALRRLTAARLLNQYIDGPGLTIDTNKPFTVVTQFPTNAEGVMQAIVRKYVQDGVVYEQAAANITNDQAFCDSFGGATEAYNALGGHEDAADVPEGLRIPR